MSIKSKVHNYGHEHESEWPPRFPEKPGYFSGYWDATTQRFIEGRPPQPEKFGEAPQVIFDSMPATIHPDAGRVIESRKEWNAADQQFERITFSSHDEVHRHVTKGIKDEKKELQADRRKASMQSKQAWKENPKEQSDKLRRQREIQRETAKKSGLDKVIKEAIKGSI